MAVRIGSRYVARAVIGRGSSGTVFRADGPDGRVAAKLLRPELAADPEVVRGFLRERDVLQRLDHPGIVPVRDLVAEADVLALVTELVDGPDLRSMLSSEGAMPPVDAAQLVADVAAALGYAHAQGVVHRDVKPENILLANDRRPRLTDFGVARLVAAGVEATAGREMIGTAAYLAPELVAGAEAGPGVDVYACGVLLYELVDGQPPFTADHPISVVHQHVTEQPRRPVGVPDELWRVIAACLAKQPEQRPDADTVRVLLTEWAARPEQAARSELATGSGLASPDVQQTVLTETVRPDSEQPVRQPARGSAVPARPRAATQVLAGIAAPGVPDADFPAEPRARRRFGWLGYAAAMVAVAAVFFAAGYWFAGLTSDPQRPPGAQPSGSKSATPKYQTRYLSDLPLVQIANGWGPVEFDRTVGEQAPDDGGTLVLGETTYERGLGTHAPSHIRVHPPEGCDRFDAVVGIDAVAQGGSVVFQVYVDDELRYDSGLLTRDSEPESVQVEILDAAAVDLVVADGGDGRDWDHADWADARLRCD